MGPAPTRTNFSTHDTFSCIRSINQHQQPGPSTAVSWKAWQEFDPVSLSNLSGTAACICSTLAEPHRVQCVAKCTSTYHEVVSNTMLGAPACMSCIAGPCTSPPENGAPMGNRSTKRARTWQFHETRISAM